MAFSGSSIGTELGYVQNDSSVYSQQKSYNNNENGTKKSISQERNLGDTTTLYRQDTLNTDVSSKSYVSDGIVSDGIYFPPLEKVLMNQSGSPLSQYNFYYYLKQEWQGEENLNFWLDVVTHENLFESWRLYQNHVKKSRERRSYEEKNQIIYEQGEEYEQEEIVMEDWEPTHDYNNSTSSAEDDITASVDSRNPVISITQQRNKSNKSDGHEISIIEDDQSGNYSQPEIIKRVNEDDLAKSALSIYQKYGHMTILPEESRNTMSDLIEHQGRYNPVVFSSAKSYVYHIMNVIYFPKFVQSAIEMNLTRIHAIFALPLGIVCLTFGLALELYYIFMGCENRLLRLYGFPVLWLGWIFLQTAATRFMPLLSLFGVSECDILQFHKIRERSILSAHRKRAFKFLIWDTLASILTLGIMFAIPPITLYDT
ncbi:hypothetical protein Glove_106g50 [Diversispora epigaea]|uniref:RGS domain-containing protein n=1 Tax=Diversispora epigaea TaxID=1348612 RepID=A0A397J9K9_9GLOM|nr:hypothetical protein Glove_106g50 [Diversispora epigaea]